MFRNVKSDRCQNAVICYDSRRTGTSEAISEAPANSLARSVEDQLGMRKSPPFVSKGTLRLAFDGTGQARRTMTKETPQFFLNRDGYRLFSILHHAAGESNDRAVVVCAPLFDEKLWSHRVLVNFARHLAAGGVSVLRFDYYGDGESEGRFEDASVRTRVCDIHDAIDFCRRETKAREIFLLGLGYGATLALRAALEKDQNAAVAVAGVVAWAPVIDGERYLNDILRAHLSAQLIVHRKVIHDREALVGQIMADQSVNIEGYEICRPLFAEIVEANVLELLRGARTPVLVQQIGPTERVDSQYLPLAQLAGSPVQFEIVQELKFWTQQKKIFPGCENLFTRTAQWLASRQAA
jgi:alpha/beta superfamily hydrolase